MRWIQNWLIDQAQGVVISSAESSWRPVASGVPQGIVLGAAVFKFAVSDVDEMTKCALNKVADDVRLGGVVDSARRQCCHPGRPRQAGELDAEEPGEALQRQAQDPESEEE